MFRVLFCLFAQEHTVALDIELLEQIADGEVLLLLTADINVNSIYCRSIIERLCNAYGTTPDATEAIKDTFDQGLSHYQIETGVEASYETMRDSLDDSEPGQRRRPAAIIISIIILGLVGLAAFSYIFNSCQYRRASNTDTDYDLPSLIAPPRLPLDEMKVPQ